MRRFAILIGLTALLFFGFLLIYGQYWENYLANKAPEMGRLFYFVAAMASFAVVTTLINIVSIPHILYVNRKTKKLATTPSLDYFRAVRTKKGLNETMTKEEIEQGFQLLNEAYKQLSVLEYGENGNEIRTPRKMKELLKMWKLVDKAGELMPTHKKVWEHYNSYRVFLYGYLRRTNTAQRKVIVYSCFLVGVLSIVPLLMIPLYTIPVVAVVLFPVLVYYMSSNEPQYLIDKRSGNTINWNALSIAIGEYSLATAPTTVTTTTWSDGTTTTKKDDFAGYFALAWIFISIVIAIKNGQRNYFRNYVFYSEPIMSKILSAQNKKKQPKSLKPEFQVDSFAIRGKDKWYYPCKVLKKEGNQADIEFFDGKCLQTAVHNLVVL